jgi:hypothetical protein
MARLFSYSEYIDIVLAYGEASGVLLASREFPCYLSLYGCYFFLWGVHEGLSYINSISIDTIEVLRERVENAATIRNERNAGKSGRIISSAPSLLY